MHPGLVRISLFSSATSPAMATRKFANLSTTKHGDKIPSRASRTRARATLFFRLKQRRKSNFPRLFFFLSRSPAVENGCRKHDASGEQDGRGERKGRRGMLGIGLHPYSHVDGAVAPRRDAERRRPRREAVAVHAPERAGRNQPVVLGQLRAFVSVQKRQYFFWGGEREARVMRTSSTTSGISGMGCSCLGLTWSRSLTLAQLGERERAYSLDRCSISSIELSTPLALGLSSERHACPRRKARRKRNERHAPN